VCLASGVTGLWWPRSCGGRLHHWWLVPWRPHSQCSWHPPLLAFLLAPWAAISPFPLISVFPTSSPITIFFVALIVLLVIAVVVGLAFALLIVAVAAVAALVVLVALILAAVFALLFGHAWGMSDRRCRALVESWVGGGGRKLAVAERECAGGATPMPLSSSKRSVLYFDHLSVN